MKVLLRKYGDRYYVWKDAKYQKDFYVIDHGNWDETKIVAIKGAEKENYVVCRYCGEKIPNNPESIERHFAEQEAKRDCLTCGYCRPGNSAKKNVAITKNNDETYTVTETYTTSSLMCDQSYRDINHQFSRNNCPHNQCRQNGTTPYGSILMKYPDLFETQITNDLLLKKKYEYRYSTDNEFMYDLKCRNTFFACVNEIGIVDHFLLNYQYRHTFFYYSAKYDKLFYVNNGKYTEGKPNWVSQTKYDQISARVRSLYKGVKVDE